METPKLANFQNGFERDSLELLPDELQRHVYAVGRTGSGKSTLLYNLALSLIATGEGLTFIDPHGDDVRRLLDTIPPERTEDVCYVNAADLEQPVGLNPLAAVPVHKQATVADDLTAAFQSIFADSWGERLHWFLRCGIGLLAENGDHTLQDLPPLYYDQMFRKRLSANIVDAQLQRFWHHEYPSYEPRYRSEAAGPILNKIGQFLLNPYIRALLAQRRPKFEFSTALDRRQIILVNLAKGRIGAKPAAILGALLIAHYKHLAMLRDEQTEAERVPHTLIVDEFQSFNTTAIADLLSEARKYRLSLVLSHQFMDQLSDQTSAAILGNVGTMIAFRVGVRDAKVLADEFHPLPMTAFIDQAPYRAWIKRGQYLQHFPIETLPPQPTHRGRYDIVVAASRRRFGRQA